MKNYTSFLKIIKKIKNKERSTNLKPSRKTFVTLEYNS